MNPLDRAEGINQAHGSPFDRGAADSYYRRGRVPHKMVGKTINTPYAYCSNDRLLIPTKEGVMEAAAKTDILLRIIYPKNPELASAILKFTLFFLSLLLLFF
jgi:hypothetical protein